MALLMSLCICLCPEIYLTPHLLTKCYTICQHTIWLTVWRGKRKRNGHCNLSARGYISLYFIFNGQKSIYFQFFVLSLHFRHPFLSPSTYIHVPTVLYFIFFPIFHGYVMAALAGPTSNVQSNFPFDHLCYVFLCNILYVSVCIFFVSLFSFYDGSGYRISLTLTHTHPPYNTTHTFLSSTCRDENRKLNEGKTFALVRTFLFNFVPFSSRTPRRQPHRSRRCRPITRGEIWKRRRRSRMKIMKHRRFYINYTWTPTQRFALCSTIIIIISNVYAMHTHTMDGR